ncbi:MAG: alkaline phosphatase family protein [Culturomica sp.]|jgi:hypothetical protein|nr:alkaline phosphatase family protein [Culturomica sp.]
MTKRSLLLVAFLLNALFLFASENKTKLVVGITLNQFYPEWFTIYANELGEGGLKRILHQGKMTLADYEYAYSQSGTDQATLYSGLLPSEHGIVAHDWYNRLRKVRENSVRSGSYAEIGEGGRETGASPEQLQTLTAGCVLKMNNVFSRVYSIGLNAEEAVLSGGSCADMAFWLSEKSGKWVSSAYYADTLPRWMHSYNRLLESDFMIRKGWMSLEDEMGGSAATRLRNKIGLGSGFFYDLSQARKQFNTYRVLKGAPYGNTLVADLAGKVVDEAKLGKDNDVDLLALNFSALDYMNRDFGVYAPEFRDLVLRLDRDVKKLLELLDQKVGRGNYTVFMTFSEARELLPEELEKLKVHGDYFRIFKSVSLLKSYLNLVYGAGEWIADYDAGQIYLNRELIEAKKLSLQEVQDLVAGFLIEFEGVSKVLTAYSLTHNAFAYGQEWRMQNAFSQKRSGDVLFCLQPAWIPALQDKEDFYFRYSKRTKVPLYFYGAGAGTDANAMFRNECRMTDVLPTLCRLAGIPAPYTAQGEFIF